MSAPRVSFVIPVYNGLPFLDSALQSARQQTVTDIEIIVIDDGSTDGSLELALRHEREDSRVHVFSQTRGGVVAARNLGAMKAQAPWIAFLDADDEALSTRVERQLEVTTTVAGLAALGTYGVRIGTTGRELGVFDVGPASMAKYMEKRDSNRIIYLLTSSVMVNRNTFLRVGGFREQPGQTEDIDLWSRLAEDGAVLALPERLVRYRIHPSSATARNFRMQMLNTRRIAMNIPRRRIGLPEITFEEFMQEYEAQPWSARLRDRAKWRSQYYYRVAGGLLANRNAAGVFWLLLSFLIAPGVPLERLRKQILPALTKAR